MRLSEDIQEYMQRNRLVQPPTEITPHRRASQTFGGDQSPWSRESSHNKQPSFNSETRTPQDDNSSFENLDVGSKNQLLYQYDTPGTPLQQSRLSERHFTASTETNQGIQCRKLQDSHFALDQSPHTVNSMVMRNKSGYYDLETLEILIM